MILGVDYDTKNIHIAALGAGVILLNLKRIPVWSPYNEVFHEASKYFFSGSPELVVVEAPIYIQNAKTSFALARVHTIITLACEEAHIKFTTLGATRWKKLAMGEAKVNKEETLKRMRDRFGDDVTDHHFADSIGLALAGKELIAQGLL